MVTPTHSIDELIEEGKHVFEQVFKMIPEVVAMAPGGINLLGEHTEYSEGLVFPMAIPMTTIIVGRKSHSRSIRLMTTAENVDSPRLAEFFAPLNQKPLERGTPLWANFFKGVIQYFDGPKVGFDAVILSSVPIGRGLSSSAALEVAAYTFLETVTGVKSDLQLKAKICQRAEYMFGGNDTDLSDQMNSVYAKEGHGTLIDCRTYEAQNIAIPTEKIAFLIVDYQAKIDTPEGFVSEMKKALDKIAKMSNKSSLRGLTFEDLDQLNRTGCIEQEMYMKARFILEENERVMKGVNALTHQNYEQFGCLMNESHDALKTEYEITLSADQDELVGILRDSEGVLGAKVLGGGHSGCLVALIYTSATNDVVNKVKNKYSGKLDFYLATPAGGPKSIILQTPGSK